MSYYEDSWLWGPLKVVVFVACLYVLTGCATIKPPTHLEPNWQDGHYISPIEPMLVTHWDLGIFRYLKWEGEETFRSWSLQPFGTAGPGESKRPCFQIYWGVKIDGTETLKLRKPGAPKLWDYVYTPNEQWATRWRSEGGCGYPNVWDMGGS